MYHCPFCEALMRNMSDGFLKEVLYKLRNDEIGSICKRDPFIIIIGKRLWMKSRLKMDKQGEVRKSVMTSMRRLGALYRVSATGSPYN